MSELRRLRKAAGLTQMELGPRVGIDHSQISRYENGQQATVEHALLLGQFFGVAPDEFCEMPRLPEVAHG